MFQLEYKSNLIQRIAGRTYEEFYQKDEYKNYKKVYRATNKDAQKAYVIKFDLINPGYKKMKNDGYRVKQNELKQAMLS